MDFGELVLITTTLCPGPNISSDLLPSRTLKPVIIHSPSTCRVSAPLFRKAEAPRAELRPRARYHHSNLRAGFNSTIRVTIKTKLPPGVTQKQGVDMLHDKDFFINCDPCLEKYELLEKEVANPEIPRDRVKGLGPTTSYKVHDIVENVPKAVWTPQVELTNEVTDIERGVFSRIKAPLNVVMETVWEIREAEDASGLELVEEADIKCSKLLVGMIKEQCERDGKCQAHISLHQRPMNARSC